MKSTISINLTDIKRIKEYYQRLMLTNLIPRRSRLIPWKTQPAKTHTKTNNLNRTVSIREVELIVNNFPKQKALAPDGVNGEFYQIFKKEILYNLFQRIEANGTLLNSFYEASIILILKGNKQRQKENYRPVFLMDKDVKILNKILANWFQQCIKRITYHEQVGFNPRYIMLVQHSKNQLMQPSPSTD